MLTHSTMNIMLTLTILIVYLGLPIKNMSAEILSARAVTMTWKHHDYVVFNHNHSCVIHTTLSKILYSFHNSMFTSNIFGHDFSNRNTLDKFNLEYVDEIIIISAVYHMNYNMCHWPGGGDVRTWVRKMDDSIDFGVLKWQDDFCIDTNPRPSSDLPYVDLLGCNMYRWYPIAHVNIPYIVNRWSTAWFIYILYQIGKSNTITRFRESKVTACLESNTACNVSLIYFEYNAANSQAYRKSDTTVNLVRV